MESQRSLLPLTYPKIMSRKDKTVKMLTGGVKMTVNSYGVTIVEKEAVIEGEKSD